MRGNIVGVDLGGTYTKLSLIDGSGEILRSERMETLDDEGPASWVERLSRFIESKLVSRTPAAVGLAVAGLVSPEGELKEAPNLDAFAGFDLAGEISARLGVGVVVENDVNAAAVGEWKRGAARGCQHVVMLALGTGVGGALILDGRLYRGHGGAAGELGHLTLQVDGPPCTCGRPGHVEAYLGAQGIVVHAGSRMGDVPDDQKESLVRHAREEGELTPKTVALAAGEGDPLARGILADVGRLLGVVCANLANAFDPQRIVIGGGIAGAGDLLLGPARTTLMERAMTTIAHRVQIVPAALGQDAAAIGAALLALEALEGEGD